MGWLVHFSCVRLFETPWTVAHQPLLSTGFSRQEYWSGLPCHSPGDLPNPGIEPTSLMSPALAGRFFTTSATGKCTHLHTHKHTHISTNTHIPAQTSIYIHVCMLSRVCFIATPWTTAHQAPVSRDFFQARILECVAIFFSRGSSWPRDGTHISCIGRQILYNCAPWETCIYTHTHTHTHTHRKYICNVNAEMTWSSLV